MPLVHTTVTFTTKSHLVKDEVVNSFTTSAGTVGSGSLAAATQSDLVHFYNDAAVGVSLASLLSPVIDRTVNVVQRSYLLSETNDFVPDAHAPGVGFGSPILVSDFTLGPGASGSGAPLPEQCAVTLSVHADRTGTAEHSGPGPRTAERRRGRVYLGPWATAIIAIDPSTGAARISAPCLASCVQAGQRLVGGTLPDHTFMVWSRKDNHCYPIIGGFVDNRFDTQRRRAETATFRSVF